MLQVLAKQTEKHEPRGYNFNFFHGERNVGFK